MVPQIDAMEAPTSVNEGHEDMFDLGIFDESTSIVISSVKNGKVSKSGKSGKTVKTETVGEIVV